VALRHDFKHEREALAGGQNPFAASLGCSDSRIAREYAFDSGRGDLFVVRVAGNFATEDGIASMEHAVSATISSLADGTTLPGHLPSLVTGLAPVVRPVLGQPGNVLENATRRNVALTVERLRGAAPILDRYVSDGKVRVAGGLYRLDTGKVELVG
jgi:carbonic anhydrase